MKDSLRMEALGLIAALALQYAVGMYITLFVTFPQGSVGDLLWQFAWRQWPIALHIVLAILIFLGAAALCFRAVRSRERVWLWPSVIALLAVLAAGMSGASFVPTQNDVFSYSMALAFLIAALSYAWGIYAAGQRTIFTL